MNRDYRGRVVPTDRVCSTFVSYESSVERAVEVEHELAKDMLAM